MYRIGRNGLSSVLRSACKQVTNKERVAVKTPYFGTHVPVDSVCGCVKNVFVSIFDYSDNGIEFCGYCTTVLEARQAWEAIYG